MHGPTAEPARGQAQTAGHALIDAYREDSPFFFATQSETLLAHRGHVAARVARTWNDELVARVERDLHDLEGSHRGARLALALPFARGDVARGFLLRGAEVARGSSERAPTRGRSTLDEQAGFAVTFQPTPARYMDSVTAALRAIGEDRVEKVVLGRRVALSFDGNVDAHEFLRRFHAQNASGYVFALDVGGGDRRRTLMGASPELLLQKRGSKVVTNPLAGSRPRRANLAEDQALAASLLSSEKDRREHDVVVAAVAEALAPFCRELHVPARPSLLATPTMWHLSTAITGELRDPTRSSLALVEALHPTPAVAGEPRDRATALIGELEPHSRGYFAGAVGHCDARGDGEWAVTLRCAELEANTALLFAGAGIVSGSDPAAELDETSAKFRTALRALGVPLLSGSP